MATYGAFSSSVLGMMSQSHALNTIGTNIANVNTGAYKKTETRFATLLSNPLFNQSDLGGITPKDYQMIDKPGPAMTTNRDMDVAINGHGFLVLSTAQSGGSTYYGRDGSFTMTNSGTESVVADDGSNITINTSYLTDKNGYFVQGWTADATTGLFPTTGTLSSLRMDEWAFVKNFQASTTAELAMNLPSTAVANDLHVHSVEVFDSKGSEQAVTMNFTKSSTNNQWSLTAITSQAAVAQVDTVTIGGATEAGDTYTITINGKVTTHTVVANETLTTVRDGLISAINVTPTTNALVTAAAGTAPGTITLTSKVAGEALTTTAAAVHGGSSVAQVDNITVGGTVEAGDQYTATINGTAITYTAVGGDTLNLVRDGLIALINANGAVNGAVTASSGGAAIVTITSDAAGTAVTTATSAVHGGSNVAQVDNVTIGGGADAGDIVRATINGTAVDYTVQGGDTINLIRDGLIAAINANVTVNGAVTATNGGAGIVTITADTAGTAFTLASSVPTDGGAATTAVAAAVTANYVAVADNTATVANATANYVALNDNTATVAATTANVATTQTTAAQTLTFNAKGAISSTNPVTLALAFSNGGAATVAFDMSKVTQFAGDFTPYNYSKNGYGASQMTSATFDQTGHVIGFFEDLTSRAIYKLPLAGFGNVNGLEMKNGNVFAASEASGTARITEASAGGLGTFIPAAREMSNVDIADEFTLMIMTQNAYNSSATVFRTVDEMTQTARDLKR